MKAKRLTAGFLALAMIIALAACSSESQPAPAGDSGDAPAQDAGQTDETTPAPAADADASGKLTVTFWHAMGGVNGEQTELMANNFNASQDAYFVDQQYQGSYDDELVKLKTAMTSGTGPDVVQVYDIGSKYMVDSGYTIPISDLAELGGFDLADIEPNCVSYYSVDGKLQSMPFNSSTPMLYYNKDAFVAAGLDPDSPPTTFAELKEYAEKLTVEEGGRVSQYGFSMAVYGWFFEQLIAGQGEYYADNENGRAANATAVAFDSNGAGLRIVETWMDLLDSGYATNYGRTTADTQNAFIAGRTAMIFESTAIIGSLNTNIGGAFELGTGYLPKITENAEGGVIIGGGSLWAIDNGDDDRKAGTWEFIKFAASPETQATWSQGTGYFAVNPKAYELDSMQAYIEENPNFVTAINQLHDAPTNGYTQGALLGVFSEARVTFESNMEEVINGSQTPEQCIENAASAINAALDNYNATTN